MGLQEAPHLHEPKQKHSENAKSRDSKQEFTSKERFVTRFVTYDKQQAFTLDIMEALAQWAITSTVTYISPKSILLLYCTLGAHKCRPKMSESPIPRVRRKELPSDGVWAGGVATKFIFVGRTSIVIIGKVRNSLRVNTHLLWFLKSVNYPVIMRCMP